jgi:hypothetical protein
MCVNWGGSEGRKVTVHTYTSRGLPFAFNRRAGRVDKPPMIVLGTRQAIHLLVALVSVAGLVRHLEGVERIVNGRQAKTGGRDATRRARAVRESGP